MPMIDLDSEFARACAAFDGTNFDELSERDKILVTIWGLEADVNNGGFDQYFFNGSGDQAHFAPEALERIGASEMAAIVRKANSLFGENGPPADSDTRQGLLESLTERNEELFDDLDRQFYEYPNDLAALLAAYLSQAQ
jgi:hypothetical protein